MSIRLLVGDAPFDLPTRYLTNWLSKIVNRAREMGVQVLWLQGAEMTAGNIQRAMQEFSPDYIVLGGHGSDNVFTGLNMTPVFVGCVNDEILAGSETLFVSCLTGRQLVPSVVRKGGIAAAGFTAEYTWVISEPFNPETDPFAKPFERMIVEPVLEVLRGGGWTGWYNKLQSVADEEERRWGLIDDPLSPQVVLAIRQDRRAATWTGVGGGAGGGGGLVPLVVLLALIG